MTINTKFSIDDDIYFMKSNQIRKGKIFAIDIVINRFSEEQPFKIGEKYHTMLYAVNSSQLLNSTDQVLYSSDMYKDTQALLQLLADNI